MEHTVAGDMILVDTPFFRLYEDGRVDRLTGTETIAAGLDHSTGVISKDVVIDPDTGVYVRIYLPGAERTENSPEKLPVLVYFHGGGFIVDSPASPTYHRFVTTLTASAHVVAVSVGYRLVPEHYLPAAYDDCWSALNWVLSRHDPWLADHADVSRVFLAGDSAGANISHNLAMRAGLGGLQHLAGAIILHPGFIGKELVSPEESPEFRMMMERVWRFAWGSAAGVVIDMDDPRLNPMAPAAPRLALLGCRKLLVCVADDDFSAPRGRAYLEAVKASGWPGQAELFESAGEGHVFFLEEPESEKTAELVRKLVSFLTIDGHGK